MMRRWLLTMAFAACHAAMAQPASDTRRSGFDDMSAPTQAMQLEWQSLGSLQRRLRNCMTGVRAEPFAHGDPALVALALYLAWRDRGMTLEAPAVRP